MYHFFKNSNPLLEEECSTFLPETIGRKKAKKGELGYEGKNSDMKQSTQTILCFKLRNSNIYIAIITINDFISADQTLIGHSAFNNVSTISF